MGAWAGGCGGHLCDHGGLAYGPPLQRVEGLLRVGRVLEESEGHGPGARARHEVHRDVARQLADQIEDHRVGRACTQGVRASACACVLGRGAAGDARARACVCVRWAAAAAGTARRGGVVLQVVVLQVVLKAVSAMGSLPRVGGEQLQTTRLQARLQARLLASCRPDQVETWDERASRAAA